MYSFSFLFPLLKEAEAMEMSLSFFLFLKKMSKMTTNSIEMSFSTVCALIGQEHP